MPLDVQILDENEYTVNCCKEPVDFVMIQEDVFQLVDEGGKQICRKNGCQCGLYAIDCVCLPLKDMPRVYTLFGVTNDWRSWLPSSRGSWQYTYNRLSLRKNFDMSLECSFCSTLGIMETCLWKKLFTGQRYMGSRGLTGMSFCMSNKAHAHYELRLVFIVPHSIRSVTNLLRNLCCFRE